MFDVPSIHLPDIMDGHARTRPHATALVCEDRELTWRELAEEVRAFASFLTRRGLGRGDRVAILAEPRADAIVAQFGVLRAGACVASLSGMASGESLAAMIRDSGSRLLIVDEHFAAAIAGIENELPDAATLPRLHIGAGDAASPSFTDALAQGRGDPIGTFAPIENDDPFVILYSSGTTGVPKGIVLSHGCRLSNAYILALELRYDSNAIVFSATALYSNTTWTLLTLAFTVGGACVVMRKFDAGAALGLMTGRRISHTILVPAALRMVLDADQGERADFAAVRSLCTTGSQMPQSLKEQTSRRFPGAYFEIYGLTEGLVLILKPEDAERHLLSVGRPMLGNDIRIVDDDGLELAAGEKGEIVGYGPMLMRGYHGRPDATEAAIWREPASGRTFLRSGDIGYFDEDGFLHLVDRKKDMLVSGGYNVYPADIERVAAQHAAVLEVAVIGIPHDKWGETPLACIVARPGHAPEEDALRQWINARVGKHERVAAVRCLPALPRNAGGKVLKRELRDAFAGEKTS